MSDIGGAGRRPWPVGTRNRKARPRRQAGAGRGQPGRQRRSTGTDADIAALERQLSDLLGLNVRIAHSEKGGTLTLTYGTLDQLDMVCQRLTGDTI